MNLKHLSNLELWDQTKNLVSQERQLTTQVLWHLREVSSRGLHLERGYSNLFTYCVEELGYTPGSAGRRVKAMKLLKDLPEPAQKKVEAALNEGKVSLSNMSTLQYFFEKEKKHCHKEFSSEEKLDLISKIEGKTQEECQRLLYTVSQDPEKTMLPQEKERVVSETKTEIKLILDQELLKKLQRIKELTAHQNPNPSYAELLTLMADHWLKQIDPELKEKNKKNRKEKSGNQVIQPDPTEDTKHAEKVKSQLQNSAAELKKTSRTIPNEIKQKVYQRDHGRCTFQDPLSHKICGSTYGLEFDHVQPVALGGESTLENLRLRCKPHNLLEAKRIFGENKMNGYLNR